MPLTHVSFVFGGKSLLVLASGCAAKNDSMTKRRSHGLLDVIVPNSSASDGGCCWCSGGVIGTGAGGRRRGREATKSASLVPLVIVIVIVIGSGRWMGGGVSSGRHVEFDLAGNELFV